MRIDKQDFQIIHDIIANKAPGRIEITRGCTAAKNGGCACLGICKDVIGHYENGGYTPTETEQPEKKLSITSYLWNNNNHRTDS